MSYNTELQSNNADLQAILDAVNALPEPGVDTSDATATAEDIMYGQTAYVNGEKLTGTYRSDGRCKIGTVVMNSRGYVSVTISADDPLYEYIANRTDPFWVTLLVGECYAATVYKRSSSGDGVCWTEESTDAGTWSCLYRDMVLTQTITDTEITYEYMLDPLLTEHYNGWSATYVLAVYVP